MKYECKLNIFNSSYLIQTMRIFSTLITGSVVGLKVGNRVTSQLSLPFTFESAEVMNVPPSDDIVNRYCEADPSSTPRLSMMEFGGSEDGESNTRDHLLYGKCEDDSDCTTHGKGRPYCVDSICRECREGFEMEDCGPVGAFCNSETDFTCSSCATDSDCPSLSYCRSVSTSIGSNKMPKKSCVKCDSVPESGEVMDVSACSWRCPIEKYFLPASGPGELPNCMNCPACSAGQFYAPRTRPTTQFVSACTNATDVICNDCSAVGIDDKKRELCATILSPSMRNLDDLSVGDLGSHMPCRFFLCKEGWFLSGTRSKCKKCHLTMCPTGQFLKGCGVADPGTCASCPGRLPRGAFFIDATDPRYSIKTPEEVCQFKCASNKVYDPEENACVECDTSASADDSEACNDSRLYTLSIQ